MRIRRERPADFDEVCARMGNLKKVKAHYKAGDKAIRRWIADTENPRHVHCYEVPEDFAIRARVMHAAALERHYGRAGSTIERWAKVSGVKPAKAPARAPHNRKPLPDDFAARAPTLTKSGLKQYYMITDETLARWLSEAGVEAKKYRPPVYITPRKARSMIPTTSLPKQWTEKTYTKHDHAADVLRRNRWVVFHCDEKGRAALRGGFWRVGNVICTPDELLERAAKYERAA